MKIITAPNPLQLTQLQTLAESRLAVCHELATLAGASSESPQINTRLLAVLPPICDKA